MALLPKDSRCERNRGFYAAWIAVVICCGLGSRSEFLALPAFLAKYVGDALWALMIFLGFGFLLPAQSTAAVAGMAVAVCLAVECSQLYHAPWIDAVRHTWFGRMALGDTFGWGDLAAYLVGIVVGGVAEWAACRTPNHKPANRALLRAGAKENIQPDPARV